MQGVAQLAQLATATEAAAAAASRLPLAAAGSGASCSSTSSSLSGFLQRRGYSYLPSDIAEAARHAKFPQRRPRLQSELDAAAAVAPGETLAKGATQQEAAQMVSSWMLPWERRQMEGGKLKPWEKVGCRASGGCCPGLHSDWSDGSG